MILLAFENLLLRSMIKTTTWEVVELANDIARDYSEFNFIIYELLSK